MKKQRSKTELSEFQRKKGKDYELKIARVLSKWWGSPLHRTPTSGMHIYSGDIVDDKGEFPFIVECKKNEQWSFGNLFEKDSLLFSFWEKARNDYLECDPHHSPEDPPLLIFGCSFSPDFFMMYLGTLCRLQEYGGSYPSNHILVPQKHLGPLITGKLADFIAHFPSDMVRTIPEFRRKR